MWIGCVLKDQTVWETHGIQLQERFFIFLNGFIKTRLVILVRAWACDMWIQYSFYVFFSFFSYFWPFLVFVHFSSVFTETRTAGDFRGATPPPANFELFKCLGSTLSRRWQPTLILRVQQELSSYTFLIKDKQTQRALMTPLLMIN